ncbi:MAG: hypothetical protein M1835_003258, partial [Candelina submexicana]
MQYPGYGGNDLALIIKIVFKLKEIYQKSPTQFQTLSREGLGLEFAVKHAVKSSLNDQLSDEHQKQLALLLGTTRELLEKLHDVLKKYESLGTNDYSIRDRFLFGKEDVRHLQEQMRTQSAAFHSFRTDIISTKVTEIKDLLNDLLKEKAQAGAITATSSYAVVAQDLTDGLASSGIPQDFISNNGPLIVKLIADLFNKQGYSIDSDTDIDPISSVVADEKFLEDVVEPEGDDQEIIKSWLSDPDHPPIHPYSIFPKDQSPSFRTSMSEATPQRQGSGSSRYSNVEDVSLHPAGSRTSINQCTKTKSTDSVSNSEDGLFPTSMPPTSNGTTMRPPRSITSPTTNKPSSNTVKDIPRSNPAGQNFSTETSLGIVPDHDVSYQSAESRPPLKSTPSDRQRKSSGSSGAGNSSSSPKSSLTKVVSSKF